MAQVPVRELRNNTAEVLRRVAAGLPVTITVNGVPVADLVPTKRSAGISRDLFVREILSAQADSGLRTDLAKLGQWTDELEPPR